MHNEDKVSVPTTSGYNHLNVFQCIDSNADYNLVSAHGSSSNQSTIDVLYNSELLTNIRQVDTLMNIQCNAVFEDNLCRKFTSVQILSGLYYQEMSMWKAGAFVIFVHTLSNNV